MCFRLFMIVFIVCSCSTSPKVSGGSKAEVLYKEAQEYIRRKRYFQATERLNSIRSKFPYSYYAIPAELMTADILFEQKTYIDATAAYLAFKDLHPKHKKMDYVLYMIGNSYYMQMPSGVDKDLTFAKQSLIYYKQLLKKYPKSKYASQVKDKLAKSESMIWGKEKYIADFYYDTKKYSAAKFRYLDILKKFPTKKELADHAQARIVKSAYHEGQYKDCFEYVKQFATKFQDSTAKAMLEYADKCAEKLKK